MSIEQLMPFFDSMSIEAQTKAYENFAYQLLDDYIYNYGEMAEEALVVTSLGRKNKLRKPKRWKKRKRLKTNPELVYPSCLC